MPALSEEPGAEDGKDLGRQRHFTLPAPAQPYEEAAEAAEQHAERWPALAVEALPSEQVVVRGTDTQYTPYDRSTGASRSTTVAGKAVELAARDVLAALEETAAAKFEVPLDRLSARAGGVTDGERWISHQDLIRARFGFAGGELVGQGMVQPSRGSGSFAEGPVFWEVCLAAAEVAVDPVTGVVRVIRTASIADVGRAINPQLIRRQDEGATLQAIGNALFEEMRHDPEGMLLNDTLLDYRVPSALDVPERMTCVIVENGDGPGPFGAKGCGEGAFAGVTAAIATAVAAAGVPMQELPMTPERVWRRIQTLGHPDREGEAS